MNAIKIYISGPITGIADNNVPAFNAAAAELRARGYEVVNPVESDCECQNVWTEYLKKDIKQMLECDAVVVLNGWNNSRGARLEVYIATCLGLPILEAETMEVVPLDVVVLPAFAISGIMEEKR